MQCMVFNLKKYKKKEFNKSAKIFLFANTKKNSF